GTRLAATDTNETGDIYRYRRGQGVECLTCVVSNAAVSFGTQVDRNVVVSDDFSHIYFESPNVLVPGVGTQGAQNMYVWHDGTIEYVAEAGGKTLSQEMYGLTSDGSVFIFRDTQQITNDENGGFEQYYRFDAVTHSLECVSCGTGTPSAEAKL